MGEQRLAGAGALLKPLVAALGEGAVAGQLAVEVRLGNVEQFLARHVGLIEGDVHGFTDGKLVGRLIE